MKQLFLLLTVPILFLIPNDNFAQRKKLLDDNKVKIRPKPINVISDKSEYSKRNQNNHDGRIKNPQNGSSKPKVSDIKDYSKRPPRFNQPKKKKKILEKEYVEVIEPTLIIEESIIFNETPNAGGYCEVLIGEPEEIEIAKYSYPEFPLRFLEANIIYQFTHRGEDYYKIFIEIEATYDNYFETFGVLIKYFGGFEQVIIFNEDHEILRHGENYKFSKQMKIEQTGYINLRIGYYEEENKIFYPEALYPNRTDKLLFLESIDKVFLNHEVKYIR